MRSDWREVDWVADYSGYSKADFPRSRRSRSRSPRTKCRSFQLRDFDARAITSVDGFDDCMATNADNVYEDYDEAIDAIKKMILEQELDEDEATFQMLLAERRSTRQG